MTMPGTEPLPPAGRGTWRLTLHGRTFAGAIGGWPGSTLLTELSGAYGRVLEQALNTPAKLSFTLNGRDPVAAMVRELQTDVVAWRWDAALGRETMRFAGVVSHAEDELTEQEHTVNFTCFDYSAMLDRRYLTQPAVYNPAAQDAIVAALVGLAGLNARTSAGVSLMPGSYLPLTVAYVNPDGTTRSQGGPSRIRTYAAQSSIGQLIHDLAYVLDGFDYDVLAPGTLRVFYEQQGITRDDPVLEYGGSIATVTRTTASDDYANYVRVVGNNGSSDPTAPQFYSELANTAANNVGVVPVGLWANIDNASDVTVQSTLDEQAAGDLDRSGVLIPSYSIGLRPGAYTQDAFDMGDTVPIVIQSGRLNVTPDTGGMVRIVGMTFAIGEDGEEDVTLTVGRPLTSLVDMLTATAADVNELARR